MTLPMSVFMSVYREFADINVYERDGKSHAKIDYRKGGYLELFSQIQSGTAEL